MSSSFKVNNIESLSFEQKKEERKRRKCSEEFLTLKKMERGEAVAIVYESLYDMRVGANRLANIKAKRYQGLDFSYFSDKDSATIYLKRY